MKFNNLASRSTIISICRENVSYNYRIWNSLKNYIKEPKYATNIVIYIDRSPTKQLILIAT